MEPAQHSHAQTADRPAGSFRPHAWWGRGSGPLLQGLGGARLQAATRKVSLRAGHFPHFPVSLPKFYAARNHEGKRYLDHFKFISQLVCSSKSRESHRWNRTLAPCRDGKGRPEKETSRGKGGKCHQPGNLPARLVSGAAARVNLRTAAGISLVYTEALAVLSVCCPGGLNNARLEAATLKMTSTVGTE